MVKFVFLALSLFSGAASATEVWSETCLDAVDDGARANAEYHVKYATIFKESLTNATIRNWLLGRSLVSVHRTTSRSGEELCYFSFAKSGLETEAIQSENGFLNFELERISRGIRSRLQHKNLEVIKWNTAQCMNVSDIYNKNSFVTDLVNKNYRLVSMIKSHGPDQCLYVFTQNLNEDSGRIL